MNLKISNHSHCPKIGEEDSQHQLRRAYHAFDQKKMNSAELRKVQKETIQETIREQEEKNLDVVTDGLILWNDPMSHLMKNLEGVEIGGLLRWFDTNCYFRQPTITGPLIRKASILKEEATFLKKNTKQETKVVMTGPYTLSLLSKIQTPAYKTREEVENILTEILSDEVKDLAQAGVSHIQIDEPGYVLEAPNWDKVHRSLEQLSANKGNAKLWLSIYFGDIVPFFSNLETLPVDVLCLDGVYSPSLIDCIEKKGIKKDLALGLLDGRNTKLEKAADVLKSIKSLKKIMSEGSTLYLTSSCGLEYLPRDRALNKLELMKDVKAQWN